MNAAQVRAKARMAMRRKEEAIERDEIEGGELNLVPYLDIISNVVLFLLASVTTGLVLGTVNSSLPEFSPAAAEAAEPQASPTEEPPLQLVVAVTRTELRLFSLSGLEGTAEEPKLRLPAQGGGYPYPQLTAAAAEIVNRRWQGRPPLSAVAGKLTCVRDGRAAPMDGCRPDRSTEVFLVVDGDVPYEAVIATMDALREAPDGAALFPAVIFSSGIK
jgi:biopolymer transport protein TolR